MARGTYKKNISPTRSLKRKKLPRQKRNGQAKKVAYEGVFARLKKGFKVGQQINPGSRYGDG